MRSRTIANMGVPLSEVMQNVERSLTAKTPDLTNAVRFAPKVKQTLQILL